MGSIKRRKHIHYYSGQILKHQNNWNRCSFNTGSLRSKINTTNSTDMVAYRTDVNKSVTKVTFLGIFDLNTDLLLKNSYSNNIHFKFYIFSLVANKTIFKVKDQAAVAKFVSCIHANHFLFWKKKNCFLNCYSEQSLQITRQTFVIKQMWGKR